MLNPRLCFTHLFPSFETKLLLFAFIGFPLLEFIAFICLDWDSKAIENLSTGDKLLVGFFQSISTRSAGFNAIDISLLNYAMWVLWIGMMYISTYPVIVVLRSSTQTITAERSSTPDRILGAFRQILLRDIFWIYVAYFWIAVAESGKIMERSPSGFSLFRILFELVSAYGTVGLSLGILGSSLSLSAQFNTISKLFVILLMLLGRHRGLPFSIDRAIRIPRANQIFCHCPRHPSDSGGSSPQTRQILHRNGTLEDVRTES
jgi:Trk-type K+ transport system membrane component